MLSEPGSKSPTSPQSRPMYRSPLYSTYSQNSYSSLPSSPSLSRPGSQLSDYSQFVPRSHSSMTKPGYTTSCPTTPLSYRRYPNPLPCPPPSSSYRSNQLKMPPQAPNKPGVFQTLYRPDLIKLSSQMQGKIGSNEKTMPHSSVDLSGDNSIDVDYKSDSSTINDDYSILCDELLEECEADVMYGNGSQNKEKSNIEIGKDNNIACMNHTQVLHLNKVKTVELVNITSIVYDIDIPDTSDYEASHSDQHNVSHEDYFNNLLAIIEQAAHSLKTL